MIVYLIIAALMIIINYKIRNSFFTILLGASLILLYNSPQISDFITNIIAAMDFTSFLYNHRFLMVLVLLMSFLLFQIYITIGINQKANYYLTKPMSRFTNMISLGLSMFSDSIKLTRPNVTNKYYLFNVRNLSILYTGSSSFIVSYVLISQFLPVANSYQAILVSSLVVIGLIFFNLVLIATNSIKQPKIDEVNFTQSEEQKFPDTKKLTLINILLIFVGVALSVVVGKIILFGLLIGLVMAFIFSVVYVDLYLHKHNQRDERVLLRNLLTGVSSWFKLCLYLISIIIFTNVCITYFTSFWQVSFYNLNCYFVIILVIALIIALVVPSRIIPVVLTIPMLLPIINLLTMHERIIYLGVFVGWLMIILFIKQQLTLKRNHELNVNYQLYLTIIISFIVSTIISMILMIMTSSLICGYVVLMVLLSISLIIIKVVSKRVYA